MTVRDIAHHLSELYGSELAPDTISRITDAVLEDVARTRHEASARCDDVLMAPSGRTSRSARNAATGANSGWHRRRLPHGERATRGVR